MLFTNPQSYGGGGGGRNNVVYKTVVGANGDTDYATPGDAFAAGVYSFFLQNGTYNTAGITVPSGTTLNIVGESQQECIINFTSTSSGAGIQGSLDTTTATSMAHIFISDCTLRYGSTALERVLDSGKAYGCVITNVRFDLGVTPTMNPAYFVILDSNVSDGKWNAPIIENCYFDVSAHQPSGSFYCIWNTAMGSTVTDCTFDGADASSQVIGMHVNTYHATGTNLRGKKINTVIHLGAGNGTISNIVSRICGIGVDATGSDYSISNVSCLFSSVADVRVSSNRNSFSNIQGDKGIKVTGGNYNSFVGGNISASGGAAISVSAGCTNTSFVGVNVGASGTALSDAGTSTIFRGCAGITDAG